MMLSSLRLRRKFMMTASTLLSVAAWCLPAGAAFDPMTDTTATGPVVSTHRPALPDTSLLGSDRPLYAPTQAKTSNGYISPLQPVAMPRPLYPQRTGSAVPPSVEVPATVRAPVVMAAPVVAMPASPVPAIAAAAPTIAPAPSLPPVDPAVAARAHAELAQQAPKPMQAAVAAVAPAPAAATVSAPAPVVSASAVTAMPVEAAPTPATFIAPAPVFAATDMAPTPQPKAVAAVAPAPIALQQPAPPKPIVMPTPTGPAPIRVAATPANELSNQSRAVLSHIPSKLDTPPAAKQTKVDLARVSPQIQDVLGKKAQEDAYNAVGLSIKVRRPGLDTNYELNQAYTSLMGGDSARAIEIYKNILGQEPRNEDALFGLAATYHRAGEIEQAKPYYAMLLKNNPNHREALNNFLTLVSEESPQDALPELERLELRNPDFSPIPAQIAIVQDKLGYPDQAEDKMLRAIELAPDNLTYKYNLAIMLDRHQRYADASALYKLLIQSGLNGDALPAPVESLQKRLNYITAQATATRAGG